MNTAWAQLRALVSLRWRMGTPLRYWMERLHPWLLITAGLVLTVHIGMLFRVDFPVLQALVPFFERSREADRHLGPVEHFAVPGTVSFARQPPYSE